MNGAKIDIRVFEALHEGRPVYRMMQSGVIAWSGVVVAIPFHVLGGDLKRLSDGCPVPYGDVLDTLDKPRPIPFHEARWGLEPRPASRFDLVEEACKDLIGGWWVGATPSLAARVFVHECGLRVAITNDLIRIGEPAP